LFVECHELVINNAQNEKHKNLPKCSYLFIIFLCIEQRALLYTGTKNPDFNNRIMSLAVMCLETSTRARDKPISTSLAEIEWPKSGNCM
jgi:hypothetical protein